MIGGRGNAGRIKSRSGRPASARRSGAALHALSAKCPELAASPAESLKMSLQGAAAASRFRFGPG